jgi:transposase-like protein
MEREVLMERRKFTREFKLEAVRLIKDRGVSYVQAERDLSRQRYPASCLAWLQTASTGGLRARSLGVAGFATSTGLAGNAGATTSSKLTFQLDHSIWVPQV